MVMYKIVNGIRVQMSSTEETARLAEEKAWNDGAFDRALEELRIKRNELLAESDWTQMMDITDGLTTEAEVKSVTWPTKPS